MIRSARVLMELLMSFGHTADEVPGTASVQDSREIVLKACQGKVTLFLQVDSDESLDTHQAARWLNIDLLRHSHPHLSGGGGHNR